jgi:hypothetical protein
MLAVAALLAALHPGCSCTGRRVDRKYPTPTVEQVVEHLRGVRTRASSFKHESRMDYWIGGQRVRGTVLVMGSWGAHLRFNGLNPTGDNVAVDLACDGADYRFIDYNNDCQLQGQCTANAIANLLRVVLAPDDFVALSLDGTPVIAYQTSSIRWEPDGGYEVVELHGEGGWVQTIKLDGRDKSWDVLSSVLRGPDGKVDWQLENKDFRSVPGPPGADGAPGAPLRLPGRTSFEQPREQADLVVRWEKQEHGVALDPAAFTMEIPAGLKRCQ